MSVIPAKAGIQVFETIYQSDFIRGDLLMKMAVIADDLTGAADTGVQFYPYLGDTILTSYQNLSPDGSGTFDLDSPVLAVFTDTRGLPAPLARERLREVARHLRRFRPARIYKKVDSCLRGHLGVEADAIMDEMGYDLGFIAPAFPGMGRTTLHDIHLLDGVPISRTEIARDPVAPVTESRLSLVVGGESRYRVAHVDLEYLEGADEALAGEIERLAGSGARHLVFDATEQRHLDRISRLALDSPGRILLVGSAGLAKGLGGHFPRRSPAGGKALRPVPGRNPLLICGTTSGRTRTQVSTLAETYPYQVISLEPGLLADPGRGEERILKGRFAQTALSRSHAILCIEPAKSHSRGIIARKCLYLQIVGVYMIARPDLAGGKSYDLAIFPHRRAGTDDRGGHLVPGRDPGAADDILTRYRSAWQEHIHGHNHVVSGI